MAILETDEEARVELVCYIWRKLNDYVISDLPILVGNVGSDLEQKLMSWIMDFRKVQKKDIFCLRLGDTPFIGMSGLYHKIDNLLYSREKHCNYGYLAECKNMDIVSLKNSLNQGKFPKIGKGAVASLIFKGLDVCLPLFFRKYFYFNARRNFCMLVTTRPLDSSALLLALSYGVCVIQPERKTYHHLFRKIDPTICVTGDILNQVPLYYPPEVLLKSLSTSKRASKANLLLATNIYKNLFAKNLESISLNFSQCQAIFQKSRIENRDIAKKISYLSLYLTSLEGVEE